MKQKRKRFKSLLIWMTGLFILFMNTSAMADICTTMAQDLTISVPYAEYEGIKFKFSLLPYDNSNAQTPFEFYWTLGDITPLESGQSGTPLSIPSDLTIAFPCINYYGTHMTATLRPILSDALQLMWKLDPDSLDLLNLPVTTTRDDKGVWFITGDDNADIFTTFEAMGYAIATDRLWQSEKYRRMARGTLSEIFGESQLQSDIQVRTTGYSDEEYQEMFKNLDLETKSLINGYVAGFNRRIAEVTVDRSQLPFEFHALGATLGIDFVPAPWTPIDVLAWGTAMLRYFDGEAAAQGQIDNLGLYQTLQAQYPEDYDAMFQDMRWQDDPDATTYIAKESAPSISSAMENGLLDQLDTSCDFQDIADEMEETQNNIVANLKKINAYVKMGSYAWVVSGDKTQSGNPILYSGPQMDHAFDFSVPSIVTEGSIKASGLNISGMTIPGMPVIIIGRTPHHAWSMQVGHAHTLDYYIENPSALSLHRTETIKVAGGEDVTLPVYRTAHGPVINSDPVISWKYAQWGKEPNTITTYLHMARATSMDQFGACMDQVALSMHYCYADIDGNIAYWMSGFDPVRPQGIDRRFPQPGDGTAEWGEPVVYKPRSHERNAARGFYSGWNSRSSHDYPNSANTASYFFGPFHRGHILEDYLSSHDNLTFEEVRDLALYIATTDSIRNEYLDFDFDTYGDGGNPWKFVSADFTTAVNADPTDTRTAALSMLENWDGHFVEGGNENWAFGTDRSDAWILMNQWISEVLKLTFFDELGKTEPRLTLFNMLLHGLPQFNAAIQNNYNWFQNKADATAPQTVNEIIVAGLDNALAALGAQPWGVGKRGEMTYTHEILGGLHSMPTASRSTYGHCVEMGSQGPVRIESMLPLGESGTILMGADGTPVFDPNFFSMSEVYDGFQHRDFPLNN